MDQLDCVFQDSDLKQYLDNCGNLMSMHNVKVSHMHESSSTYCILKTKEFSCRLQAVALSKFPEKCVQHFFNKGREVTEPHQTKLQSGGTNKKFCHCGATCYSDPREQESSQKELFCLQM